MAKLRLTSLEKKKYAVKEKTDLKIFIKIKKLKNKKLNKEDKRMLRFIKTQIEWDWRKPLIKELNKIEKNSKK